MCLGWWSEISEKLARVCTGPSSASRSSKDSSGFLTSWITRRDRRGWMDLVGIGESFGESDSANVGSSNLECAFGPMTSSVFRDCERFPCLETLEWSREDGRYLVCSKQSCHNPNLHSNANSSVFPEWSKRNQKVQSIERGFGAAHRVLWQDFKAFNPFGFQTLQTLQTFEYSGLRGPLNFGLFQQKAFLSPLWL